MDYSFVGWEYNKSMLNMWNPTVWYYTVLYASILLMMLERTVVYPYQIVGLRAEIISPGMSTFVLSRNNVHCNNSTCNTGVRFATSLISNLDYPAVHHSHKIYRSDVKFRSWIGAAGGGLRGYRTHRLRAGALLEYPIDNSSTPAEVIGFCTGYRLSPMFNIIV
jgi:hypothetical protein